MGCRVLTGGHSTAGEFWDLLRAWAEVCTAQKGEQGPGAPTPGMSWLHRVSHPSFYSKSPPSLAVRGPAVGWEGWRRWGLDTLAPRLRFDSPRLLGATCETPWAVLAEAPKERLVWARPTECGAQGARPMAVRQRQRHKEGPAGRNGPAVCKCRGPGRAGLTAWGPSRAGRTGAPGHGLGAPSWGICVWPRLPDPVQSWLLQQGGATHRDTCLGWPPAPRGPACHPTQPGTQLSGPSVHSDSH